MTVEVRSLVPAISRRGNKPVALVFREVSRLSRLILGRIPREHLRVTEWSIDYDGGLAVTACLKAKADPLSLAGIVRDIRLRRKACDQLYAIISLPCWRHTIRVDSDGGIGLYIERDWEPDLLYEISGWFGSGNRLANHALELSATGLYVVAALGIHWRRDGKARLRLYSVAIPKFAPWAACTASLIRFYQSKLGQENRPLLERLLRHPRRACVVNLEDCSGALSIKLELPGVRWSEIGGLLGYRKSQDLCEALEYRCGKSLRYLGVRFRPATLPTATFYIPLREIGG